MIFNINIYMTAETQLLILQDEKQKQNSYQFGVFLQVSLSCYIIYLQRHGFSHLKQFSQFLTQTP